MDELFAPWRIEWVERDAKNPAIEDCVFCELPSLGADRTQRVVATSERAYVLLNNYPYNPGHVMVIPRAHVGAYEELAEPDLLEHAKLKQRTLQAIDFAFEPDGCNAGLNLGGEASGGSIGDHLHTHIVPRWSGDTNFMPVIADTKVIVEGLADSYDRLHEAFADQAGATTDGTETAVQLDL
ncbi:MAG: HIT domain-containing protein [Halobacteriales archaeon]|nr:HIT domain-containing protein [Halobacteriales archaeon]